MIVIVCGSGFVLTVAPKLSFASEAEMWAAPEQVAALTTLSSEEFVLTLTSPDQVMTPVILPCPTALATSPPTVIMELVVKAEPAGMKMLIAFVVGVKTTEAGIATVVILGAVVRFKVAPLMLIVMFESTAVAPPDEVENWMDPSGAFDAPGQG